jgi:hypothetical protein
MRLWSISPSYLDRQGLLGCWRETLLAQHVLLGQTKGYKNHPQLDRFKEQENPSLAVGTYLWWLFVESGNRGYHFNEHAVQWEGGVQDKIPVTKGQVLFEYSHLLHKLQTRSPNWLEEKWPDEDCTQMAELIILHPLFYLVDGEKETWEKG